MTMWLQDMKNMMRRIEEDMESIWRRLGEDCKKLIRLWQANDKKKKIR